MGGKNQNISWRRKGGEKNGTAQKRPRNQERSYKDDSKQEAIREEGIKSTGIDDLSGISAKKST